MSLFVCLAHQMSYLLELSSTPELKIFFVFKWYFSFIEPYGHIPFIVYLSGSLWSLQHVFIISYSVLSSVSLCVFLFDMTIFVMLRRGQFDSWSYHLCYVKMWSIWFLKLSSLLRYGAFDSWSYHLCC